MYFKPDQTEDNMTIKNLSTYLAKTAYIVVVLQMLLLPTVRQVAAGKMATVPRIYNALITSDQQLIPSQADPVVSPVLHPLPFLVLPYASYSMFSLYPAHESRKYLHTYTAEPDKGLEADIGAVVNNNTPANKDIPDVPPPPLFPQKSGSKEEKKSEEFPPAPVGYAV